MRAKFVNEKFTEEGDPIRDMGIGIMNQIKDFIDEKNKGNTWNPIDINDTNEVLKACLYAKKSVFIKFLLEVKDIYDKDDILRGCIYYNQEQFIDVLIEKGAKFRNLEDKARYILKLNGTLVSFTPEEELLVACDGGDFKMFKNAIDNGVKLKMGMFNALFKNTAFSFWKNNSQRMQEREKIKDYLKDNIDNLENLIHPRDLKKLNKIKTLLDVKDSLQHKSYPQGYKIYRVLKYIDSGTVSSRAQLVKLIYELGYGKDSFNPLLNASYWSTNFQGIVYPYMNVDTTTGKFYLNSEGKAKLKKYDAKFASMKINAYV